MQFIKKNWFKILVVFLLLFIYSISLTHKINLTTDDLGRHITNGQIIWQTKSIPKINFYSYTEPDFPFLNHHWLSGLLFYFIFLIAGFNGLIAFKILVLLATFSIIFYIATKKSNFWLSAIFALPIIVLLNERTDVRPEIISFLFIAIFLYILVFYGNKNSKKIFWLVPLQLIWVNCHIYWPIGILMVGGFLFSRIISYFNLSFPRKWESRNYRLVLDSRFRGNDKKIIKKIAILLLLLILVTFINPVGLRGVTYPLSIFNNYGYQIVENKSPFFLENLMQNPIIPFFKIISFLLIISFLFNLDNFSLFYFLASVAVVIGSGKMIRNFPLLALMSLPILSINFSPPFNHLQKKYSGYAKYIKKTFPYLYTVLLIIFIVLLLNKTIKLNKKDLGLGLEFQANSSAEFFKENNLSGPLFNNYDIGSYLIFHLYNRENVFVDNRPEAYSKNFFENIYKPMQQNEEQWQKQLEKYNFNTVFFTHQEGTPWGNQFVARTFNDPEWILIHADTQAVIFIKNIPQNVGIIDRFRITPDNIVIKITPVINSSNVKTQLSAVNLLSLIGRNDIAQDICQEIIEKNPKEVNAYLELSSIELQSGTKTGLLSAKRYLEKAIQIKKPLPSIYNQLGLINFNLGEYEAAKKAWQGALKINKKDDTAKYYLEQYNNLNLP
ncbi:MAG: hypothetical protein ABH887_00765 [bacterium]